MDPEYIRAQLAKCGYTDISDDLLHEFITRLEKEGDVTSIKIISHRFPPRRLKRSASAGSRSSKRNQQTKKKRSPSPLTNPRRQSQSKSSKATSPAKEETEIANEKEIVETATVQAMGNNKYGNIEEDELQGQLDKEAGEGKTEATDIGDEFEVIFNESNRYYMVDKDGNVGEAQEIIKDENPGDITTGKDGETLDGSEEHPYEIWCIEDLVTFSNMVNGEGIKLENGNPVEITTANNFSGKYVVLKTSLNFKSKLSYQNTERTDFGDINGNGNDGNTLMNEMTTGMGFKPIGIAGKTFNGIFKGKNYKIYNFYIDYRQEEIKLAVGVFGIIFNAKISNLEISGQIKGNWETGGIAGCVNGENVEIDKCVNKANIIRI